MTSSHDGTKPVFYLLILCLIGAATFFSHLGKVHPGLMEARNFVTAREMVENGNWLIPSMDGNIRVAKPPLPTWLTAVSRLLAGSSDSLFVMRAPAAMAATLMVLFFFGLCLELTGRNLGVSLLSAAVLATNVLVIQMARTNSWDIFSQSFMVAAIWLIVRGIVRDGSSRFHFLAFGTAMGLSFLSKGPAAFYAPLFPFGAAYIWTYGFRRVWMRKGLITGALILSGLIGLLWPLPVYLKYPEFALSVFVFESEARVSWHGEPWYYYLDFPYMAGLWVVLFITVFAVPYVRARLTDLSLYRLGFIWLVLTVLLLSVLPEKKGRYLLPVSFPMSLLIGQVAFGLAERFRLGHPVRADRVVFLLHALVTALLALALPLFVGYLWYTGAEKVSTSGLLIVLGASLILLSATVLWYRRQNVKGIFVLSVVVVALTCIGVLPYARVFLYTNPEYRTINRDVDLARIEGVELYRTNEVGTEVVWDIGRSPGRLAEVHDLLLAEGKTFALLSEGHPRDAFSEDERGRLNFEVMDVFDYGEKRSRSKIYLSLVAPIRAVH